MVKTIVGPLGAAMETGHDECRAADRIFYGKILYDLSIHARGPRSPLQHAVIPAMFFFQAQKILFKRFPLRHPVCPSIIGLARYRICFTGTACDRVIGIKAKTAGPDEFPVVKVPFINHI